MSPERKAHQYFVHGQNRINRNGRTDSDILGNGMPVELRARERLHPPHGNEHKVRATLGLCVERERVAVLSRAGRQHESPRYEEIWNHGESKRYGLCSGWSCKETDIREPSEERVHARTPLSS